LHHAREENISSSIVKKFAIPKKKKNWVSRLGIGLELWSDLSLFVSEMSEFVAEM
jgi:hypothetical protein